MRKLRKIVWGSGIVLAATFIVMTASVKSAQVREINVRADGFAFSPSRIEVQKDEIVKVTFTAVDMPHSFTLDGYRIAKRAGQGQTVTFEFRADRPGDFPFVCNLTQDDRCKSMRGQLVVK